MGDIANQSRLGNISHIVINIRFAVFPYSSEDPLLEPQHNSSLFSTYNIGIHEAEAKQFY